MKSYLYFISLWVFGIFFCMAPIYCAHESRQESAMIKSSNTSPYFDTAFLQKYDQVAQSLIEKEGFKEVYFKSTDAISLNGLYLRRPNAQYTVICCAGFLPGRKEGLATFYNLLPGNCNILLFDARGHGKSKGPFLSTIYKYGVNEYKDVLGAIDFVHSDTNKPIIILGICIGSYHATKALLSLRSHHALDIYQIKGLIFDSGLSHPGEMIHIPHKHITEKIIPGYVSAYLYGKQPKREVINKWPCKLANCLVSALYFPIELIVGPAIDYFNECLTDNIHKLPIPILYIHCHNDDYTPISEVQELAHLSQNKRCWWIEESSHACHQLKHQSEYQIRLLEFLNQALHT